VESKCATFVPREEGLIDPKGFGELELIEMPTLSKLLESRPYSFLVCGFDGSWASWHGSLSLAVAVYDRVVRKALTGYSGRA